MLVEKISKFQLSTDKMIQNTDDAVSSIDLGESPDVVLNEVGAISFLCEITLIRSSKLALSSDKSHLAFGLDSGEVGVMELSSETIIRMGDKHSSVSWLNFVLDAGKLTLFRSADVSNSFQIAHANSSVEDMTQTLSTLTGH